MQAESKSEISGKSAGNPKKKKANRPTPTGSRNLSYEQILEIIHKNEAKKPISQIEILNNFRNFIQVALPRSSYSDICKMLAKSFKFNVNRSTLSTYVKQSMPDLVRPSRKKGNAGSINDRKALNSSSLSGGSVPIPSVPDDFEQASRSPEQFENGSTLPVTLRTTGVNTAKSASPSSTSKQEPKSGPYSVAATPKIRRPPEGIGN